ncbi:MAG: 20S proteasome subunit alpha 1, PSMA6 [Amphiamblys sp. WSBS2006]|nr:MAG: 20S proteasome subunit alpha 1, PSMA6 [Amphiamblys sp. WSBS2006]
MLKTGYDNDVTVWSPQGRLFQIDYACEAVKNGTVTLALKSNTDVVFCALRSADAASSSYKTKITKIDTNIAISVSGLMSDVRAVTKRLHATCLQSRVEFETQPSISRTLTELALKAQRNTQEYGGRPYGLGMIAGGVDTTGTRIFEFNPKTLLEYKAVAIGARSQAAKTYLEKNVASFPSASQKALIRHALAALKTTIRKGDETQQQEALEAHNCTVAYVSSETGYVELTESDTAAHLASV